MKILVACEYSGLVREAFKAKGHDVLSCDLDDTEIPGNHYKGDVRGLLNDGWDMMIAFPPCTHLANSGARWFHEKRELQKEAVHFVKQLWQAPIPRIAIENPIGILSTHFTPPSQIIQPWMFGHGETKATCLWLKKLPPLFPTEVVQGNIPRVHYMSPGPNRAKERSRTYQGIALAMAHQWDF